MENTESGNIQQIHALNTVYQLWEGTLLMRVILEDPSFITHTRLHTGEGGLR